jgi:hypothetical protein
MGHYNIDEYNNYIDPAEEQWKLEARCTDTDTESWFVEKGENYDVEVLNKICGECSVKLACLEYATKYRMVGYWAGTTGGDRRKLRLV